MGWFALVSAMLVPGLGLFTERIVKAGWVASLIGQYDVTDDFDICRDDMAKAEASNV